MQKIENYFIGKSGNVWKLQERISVFFKPLSLLQIILKTKVDNQKHMFGALYLKNLKV